MRATVLKPEQMTPRQREVREVILKRRGRFGGPYPVWLLSPELCERTEALTAYCRFESKLPLKLRELSILITARFWDAQFSWSSHVDPAVTAGISQAAVDAIAEKREPVFGQPDEQIFYQFSIELLRNHFVSKKTYEAAKQQFGEQGVLDIVACVGNFSTLAMLLNTFLVDLKSPPPFADIGTRPFEE